MIDVIYLAAGQGKRAKLGYPKQFARLGGKPIMVHGLEVLEAMPEIRRIYVACLDAGKTEESLMPYRFGKIFCLTGGKTRQESVFKALPYISTESVLVMEAVRPFITIEFVRQVIHAEGGFITPVLIAKSSVIEWGISMTTGEPWTRTIPRDHVGEVQMPQKFNTELLRKAHVEAPHNYFTDDADLVINVVGKEPDCILPGLEQNIKITTPLDLIIAEAIYHAQFQSQE